MVLYVSRMEQMNGIRITTSNFQKPLQQVLTNHTVGYSIITMQVMGLCTHVLISLLLQRTTTLCNHLFLTLIINLSKLMYGIKPLRKSIFL